MNAKERIEKESWKKRELDNTKFIETIWEKKREYQLIKQYLTNTTIAPHEEHP